MIALAWVTAVVGAVWAWIVSLAGAMRTVPRMPWTDALKAVPLPLVAAFVASWRLWGQPPGASGRPWVAAGLPIALAVLTLLYVAGSYFGQPGGPS